MKIDIFSKAGVLTVLPIILLTEEALKESTLDRRHREIVTAYKKISASEPRWSHEKQILWVYKNTNYTYVPIRKAIKEYCIAKTKEREDCLRSEQAQEKADANREVKIIPGDNVKLKAAFESPIMLVKECPSPTAGWRTCCWFNTKLEYQEQDFRYIELVKIKL